MSPGVPYMVMDYTADICEPVNIMPLVLAIVHPQNQNLNAAAAQKWGVGRN